MYSGVVPPGAHQREILGLPAVLMLLKSIVPWANEVTVTVREAAASRAARMVFPKVSFMTGHLVKLLLGWRQPVRACEKVFL